MLTEEELTLRRATAFRGARFTADGGVVHVGAHVVGSATTPSRPGFEAQLAALGARIAALSATAKRTRK
jgi:hypothetical protein